MSFVAIKWLYGPAHEILVLITSASRDSDDWVCPCLQSHQMWLLTSAIYRNRGILRPNIKTSIHWICQNRCWKESLEHIVGRESKPLTKTTFCQGGNIKCMVHILSSSCSYRPIRTPLKSINHATKYRIYERYHYFRNHFTEIGCFAMKKMLGWFTTKICSKCGNSSETLQIDHEIFIEFGCY